MKIAIKARTITFISLLTLFAIVLAPLRASAFTSPVSSCDPTTKSSGFLGLPHWYEYLKDGEQVTIENADGSKTTRCEPQLNCTTGTENGAKATCRGGIDVGNIWLIALAILELLLRLGGLITVGMVVFGGFKYIISQGQPDATKNARSTIINAFIGMVITIIAAVSVNFIARLLQ